MYLEFKIDQVLLFITENNYLCIQLILILFYFYS